MAAAEILAVGTDDATADVTVEAGDTIAIGLKGSGDGGKLPAGGQVLIGLKDEDGKAWTVGILRASDPVTVLSIPGTYQLKRVAGAAVGVFRAA